MIDINKSLNQLIQYGLDKGLLEREDVIYASNRLISLLNVREFIMEEPAAVPEIAVILAAVNDFAFETRVIAQNGVVTRDLFDTEIMNCLMPRPSDVNRKFWEEYKMSPEQATDYYYDLSRNSNYIRMDRVVKNIIWKTKTAYGDIDITINMSKPEKDPEAIAAAKLLPKTSYPKCLLCKENEGFAGNLNHPARANHRLIRLNLNRENWFFQYSPYVYYNEHCIVLKNEHEPMKICKETFIRLFDFLTLFPHYFIGSNADLPIVGGSILDHDHFQGGKYEFAMAKANIRTPLKFHDYPNIEAGIVNWPMSVIRLKSKDKNELVSLSAKMLEKWRGYSDERVELFAFTGDEPHNTITPIARVRDGQFEIDLVFRNNRTTPAHPLGIFHPHAEHHHIKRENIGLIEVMGLAVLPARLDEEMQMLKQYLIEGRNVADNPELVKHAAWADMIRGKYPNINAGNIDEIIRDEIGFVFTDILIQCGIFKNNAEGQEAFMRFIAHACMK